MFHNVLCFTAVQIIPASVQPATPTTIKVINSSAKAAKVQRAPRISGEDRSSPGNRTGIVSVIFKCKCSKHLFINLSNSFAGHIFVTLDVKFVEVHVDRSYKIYQKHMQGWQVGLLMQAPCLCGATAF